VQPAPHSLRGAVIACGMNPHYGDLDPYHMAASALDEAVRNCVAVGADPRRIAVLDNFCWGNTDRPEQLGTLVRAALACHDVALAFGTPFISGKDSLKNEFHYTDADGARRSITIPPTLLISALGQIADVRRAVTMDFKEPGNLLYLVGRTKNELGGSHLELVVGDACGRRFGRNVPTVDSTAAPGVFRAVHAAIDAGLVRACHDLSEGGLAVAAAEMALAGRLGAEVDLHAITESNATFAADANVADADTADLVALFSESNSRFLVEIHPDHRAAFERVLIDVTATTCIPYAQIGHVLDHDRLVIRRGDEPPCIDLSIHTLRHAWQAPLAPK